MRARRHLWTPLAVIAALLVSGCSTGNGPSAEAGSGAPSAVRGAVVVFAAASLTEAFTLLGEDFERGNPGTEVTFSFGASSALAQQIVSGAPADVLAAASPQAMKVVTDAGIAGSPQVFARNTLQIAVPSDNPGKVTGLADLARQGLTIALCAPTVPCGAAAERVFANAGLVPAPDTLEQDVKAALSKVELGEVDAALVYRTDVRAAGAKVKGIDFPGSAAVVNDYPLVALDDAPNPAAAAAFVAHVLSPEGRKVLADAGFQGP